MEIHTERRSYEDTGKKTIYGQGEKSRRNQLCPHLVLEHLTARNFWFLSHPVWGMLWQPQQINTMSKYKGVKNYLILEYNLFVHSGLHFLQESM